MKKLGVLLLPVLLLLGCSAKQEFETLTGPCCTEEALPVGVIQISVPDELSMPVMQTDNGDRLYIGDDYAVSLQTLPGGDLNATLKSCTGFERDRLTVLETEKEGLKRYDCAWTAAGEGAQSVGRLTILEDAGYHYVLTVTAQGDDIETMTDAWQQLADSFRVSIVQ